MHVFAFFLFAFKFTSDKKQEVNHCPKVNADASLIKTGRIRMFQINLIQTMDDGVYVSTVRADQLWYSLDLTKRATCRICEFTVIGK